MISVSHRVELHRCQFAVLSAPVRRASRGPAGWADVGRHRGRIDATFAEEWPGIRGGRLPEDAGFAGRAALDGSRHLTIILRLSNRLQTFCNKDRPFAVSSLVLLDCLDDTLSRTRVSQARKEGHKP